MAKPFAKILIGLAAACVVHGAAFAQDAKATFDEAVRLIRINKEEEGVAKLQELLDSSPTAEDAFEIWKSTDPAVFQMLVLDERTQKIARHLLGLARSQRIELSRDERLIAELVDKAMSPDFATRNAAQQELAANHGEFAVPSLIRFLGDEDEDARADRAMVALLEIGRGAVMPLIQTLNSDNELLRRNAAAALANIADRRAAGPLARLAQNDASDAVRFAAQSGLDAMGLRGSVDPADLLLRDATAYVDEGAVRDGDWSSVVWTWTTNGLVASDVPPQIYHLELAKQSAEAALALDPDNGAASTLLARAYMGEVAAIQDGGDPALEALTGRVAELRLPAMALGSDALNGAVEAAVSAGQVDVAEAALETLADVEVDLENSSARALLDSPNARLRYKAALLLADKVQPGTELAGKIVEVLSQAVEEESIRAILVVDGNPMTQRVAREASVRPGFEIREASSGRAGVSSFYDFPNFDVVVVSEDLPDALPEDVIALVRQRNPNCKIVLLAKSDEGEERLGSKVDAVLRPEGALTGDALMESIDGVVEELSELRARADRIAKAAGATLHTLGVKGVDTAKAADRLVEQLARPDDVAAPAAIALGDAGSTQKHADALIAVIGDEARSVEMRTAAAQGLGGVLARLSGIESTDFEKLLAVAVDGTQDAELRQAVATSLGKAKLAPGSRARLAKALAAIATEESGL
ncbi:MAG: HEAT repeat domain-containing protein [Planctomycetes bacterium]|nr:HEAT repeat domain-containing protein [Planctomycetota bacterium]